MKIIITGPTGRAGEGILFECLEKKILDVDDIDPLAKQ